MKKLFAIIAILAFAVTAVSARDKIYRDASVLPALAQQTLKKGFPKAQVNRVKVDEGLFGGKDYEVILNNGAEIEFNKEGEWEEVDCGHRAVPAIFVLKPISNYIKSNHRNLQIVKIEKRITNTRPS